MKVSPQVVFFVGPPGVGKTSLVRKFLGSNDNCYFTVKPKWTVTVDDKIVAAGHYVGGTFDGADTVPYNGVNQALQFWDLTFRSKASMTMFDGDRFSHAGVLTFFRERGSRVACVYLKASDETLSERRAERGSKQNATWMKGRASKAKNFSTLFSKDELFEFDAGVAPSQLYAAVKAALAA